MMLTEQDRKGLLDVVGKRGTRMQTVTFCTIPLAILLAALKLYMAGLWAGIGGYAFQSFFALWINGVAPREHYSGSLIKAGDEMTLCVMYVGLSLIMGAVWWRGRKKREHTQRIINSLKNSGGW
jgi:hypothetical protein